MTTVDSTDTFLRIFQPGYQESISELTSENGRLAYYTDADTALKIISNGEVWLRNATVMNDFSEIAYGLELTMRALSGRAGKAFERAADEIFPGAMATAKDLIGRLQNDWRFETYITCVSRHKSAEDQTGRLSMWRAYGDTALVVRNTPMSASTDDLGVYSIPVNYFTPRDCEDRLEKVTEAIRDSQHFLRQHGKDTFINHIVWMVSLSAIATKHPSFAEEEEWRIYFRPAEQPDTILEKRAVVIAGIPQEIWVLPLRHDPEHGLHFADISSLLDRIIIGPTAHPYVSYRAFVTALRNAGVNDAEKRVMVSDIPLRRNH